MHNYSQGKHKNISQKNGFTLIELLVVISMISALSVISIVLINPVASTGKARDGTRLANIKGIAEAIESYRQGEGGYPATADATNPNSKLRTIYLTKWPAALANDGTVDDLNWAYQYFNVGDSFLVFVPNYLGGCFKYQSDWGRVMSCDLTECKNEITASINCK